MKIEITEGIKRRVIDIGDIKQEQATNYFISSLENGDGLYKLFLALGACPDAKDKEAMKRAVSKNDKETVEYLRDHGASCDVDLTGAIEESYIDLVGYMLNNGAECKQEYVHAAISSKSEEMVRAILLRNKMEPTKMDVHHAINTSPAIAKIVLMFYNGDIDFLRADLEKAIEDVDQKMVELLFKTLTNNLIALDTRPNYEKMVENCQDAEELNAMIKLIQRYRPEIIQIESEDELSKFYPKASMETFALLGGIALDETFETMFARAWAKGNKKLCAEILTTTDVKMDKVVLYNVV